MSPNFGAPIFYHSYTAATTHSNFFFMCPIWIKLVPTEALMSKLVD